MTKNLNANQLEALSKRLGYLSWDRYAARAEFLFKGIALSNKQICDIGCGKGAWAVWSALHGAKSIGIEPQLDGCTNGDFIQFKETVKLFELEDSVKCENEIMENLVKTGKKFDVIVMYNVINHLDEEAVKSLHNDKAAASVYANKFELLRSFLNHGGILILADCRRSNFWTKLRLKNPFAKTIEWEKHQDPQVWIDLAKSSNFNCIDLRWPYLYPFLRTTSNRLVSYLTTADFVIRFEAV